MDLTELFKDSKIENLALEARKLTIDISKELYNEETNTMELTNKSICFDMVDFVASSLIILDINYDTNEVKGRLVELIDFSNSNLTINVFECTASSNTLKFEGIIKKGDDFKNAILSLYYFDGAVVSDKIVN